MLEKAMHAGCHANVSSLHNSCFLKLSCPGEVTLPELRTRYNCPLLEIPDRSAGESGVKVCPSPSSGGDGRRGAAVFYLFLPSFSSSFSAAEPHSDITLTASRSEERR